MQPESHDWPRLLTSFSETFRGPAFVVRPGATEPLTDSRAGSRGTEQSGLEPHAEAANAVAPRSALADAAPGATARAATKRPVTSMVLRLGGCTWLFLRSA